MQRSMHPQQIMAVRAEEDFCTTINQKQSQQDARHVSKYAS